jgi:prepilin signal peptidase PulO-like enzyme (type II secretory pathway)
MPLEVRIALVFLAGLFGGSLVNWGIYALAWTPRAVSPWSPRQADAPPRHWSHFLPVIGWLLRRGEGARWGAGFWVRPMLLELSLAAGLAALYAWEMHGGLFPLPVRLAAVQHVLELHAQFLSHALLILLLAVATFIDLDEQTIPDEVTLPGTLAGLVLAALFPASLLPLNVVAGGVATLHLASPDSWPAWIDLWQGLALGCAAFCGWCVALVHATHTLRKGLLKGAAFYVASVVRRGMPHLVLAAVGSAAIAGVWLAGGPRWQALATALAGMAFGGLLVWSVRIVGQAALHKEAMGFGDVTLMAMIGAFLGWQTTLIVFFLSPATALVIALVNWFITGRRDIAFGPYLCLSAVVTIVFWPSVWGFAAPRVFALGWFVPALFAACLLLMMALLMFWRFAEELLFSRADEG